MLPSSGFEAKLQEKHPFCLTPFSAPSFIFVAQMKEKYEFSFFFHLMSLEKMHLQTSRQPPRL